MRSDEIESMESSANPERHSHEESRELNPISPSRNSGLFRKRETEKNPVLPTIADKSTPQEGSSGVISESAVPLPSEPSVTGRQPEPRRIRFGDTQGDETEQQTEAILNPEQQDSDTQDATANKPGREFRLRFGLKRTKPQVENAQPTMNPDSKEPDTPPATQAEKSIPKKTRFSFPKLNFNRHGTQKAVDDSPEVLTEAGAVENTPDTEDVVEETQAEPPRLDSETQKQRKKSLSFLRRSRSDTAPTIQDHQEDTDLTETAHEETPKTEPGSDESHSASSTWWKPRRLGFEKERKPVNTAVESSNTSSHEALENTSTIHGTLEQKHDDSVSEAGPTDEGSVSSRLRFAERIQRFSDRKKIAGPIEPASSPIGDSTLAEGVSADRALQSQTGLELNIEPEEKAEEVVVNQHADGQEVFVSRLFIDRNFTQRRNAPPPSKISSSVFAQRSLAPKPGAAGVMYNTCLSKLGKVCQGLLGGLCLFFLILLLTSDHSQLRSLFGGSGGQGQMLQMLIYLLVIVSVISSFEGLDYQQIMTEKRLNRFCITSVLYPAMLILGLTVMKLDNTLVLENGVADNEWREWRTVNIVRSCLGISAWMILCV